MIDRRALLVCGAMLVLMLAATAWRLVLLPDWTHFPYFLPGATPTTRNALWLLVAPACIAFVGTILALIPRLTEASPDAARARKRWGSPFLIIYSAICAALQFFVLARSLGLGLALDPVGFARAMLVLLAGLIIVFANYIPKLPQPQSRLEMFRLDPARRAQFVRFTSGMLVLSGIAFIMIAIFIPRGVEGAPLIFSITAAVMILSFVRMWQLRRAYRREQAGS